MKINSIIQGNTLEQLKKLPSESIDTIITSPPYWGLRDYGEDTKTIWDGDKNCKHIWKTIERKLHSGTGSDFCQKCGAWYGQLGLEPTLDLYIEHLLQITAELKRVLKKSGVMFWDHGDCYNSSPPGNKAGQMDKQLKSGDGVYGRLIERYGGDESKFKKEQINYPTKCLMLQNWRLILRMIDEQGWILRNTVVWNKPNAMPSCLSPNTEVYIKSENGIIASHTLGELVNWNIENLQILTPTGWKKIKNIWKVKKREYLKFQFGSSGEVICSLDHKFPASHDNRRKNYEIKEAKDLREDKHKLLDRLLFSTISRYLDGNYKEIDGEKLDYELGKFIGLIVAEGGFNNEKTNQGKITLNKQENELMDFFTKVLKERFNQHFKIYHKDNYQSVQFNSQKIKSLYQRLVLGKCTTKSLDKVYLLNSPYEFRQGLFDGIIAGDGHIDKKGRITYASASQQLRDDVYLLASSIGFLASRYKPHKQYDKRTQKTYNSYFLTILLSLQNEVIKGEQIKDCYWNRHTKKITSAIYKNVFSAKTLKISKIKKIKEEIELIDIEVEDGLFLINGGLVSHNSVKDRFANKYEPVFFLTKNKRYFFDLDAVRIPTKTNENRPYGIVREREFGYNTQFPEARKKSAAYNWELKNTPKPMEWRKNAFNYRVRDAEKKSKQCPQFRATKEEIEMYKKEWQKQKELSYGNDDKGTRRSRVMAWLNTKRKTSIPEDQKEQNSAISRGKNPGDVWEIATQPCPKEFRGIHFASFPEKLIKPMILAGCPAQICKKCGKARERITNKKYTTSPGQPPPFTKQQGKQFQSKIKGEMKYPVRYETEYQTIGWTKCNCENPEYEAGVVLDPFIGIGTTAVIAKKLGRNFIGIEISNKYCKVANKRLENTIRQEELLSN